MIKKDRTRILKAGRPIEDGSYGGRVIMIRSKPSKHRPHGVAAIHVHGLRRNVICNPECLPSQVGLGHAVIVTVHSGEFIVSEARGRMAA